MNETANDNLEVQTEAEPVNAAISSETEGETTGRFKSAEDLLKAYTSLEKEFTKRSQKLRTLEKELSGKMVSPQKEYMLDDWRERVEKFIGNTPSVAPFKKQIADEILNGGLENNPDCLEIAAARVILNNYKSPADYLSDDEFVNEYVMKNEKIRDGIVKDYLKNLDGVKSVRTIGSAGQPALSSPIRPKTVSEAGRMVMEMAGKGK